MNIARRQESAASLEWDSRLPSAIVWLHPLTGLGGRPLKPIMWVRIPLESPFVMTYFYKRNKRCIHREKGRDTEMYPIKLS